TITLQDAKAPVKDLIPKEGATGWADTWMISSKAKHPNCAVKWIQWVSTPKVQAEQALSFRETPANAKACGLMNRMETNSWANFHTLVSDPTYRQIAFRTIWMAAAVTATDAVIAFPFAYFMARIANPRWRTFLFVLVLLPLWSSYLARIYAWRLILNHDGALNWSLAKIGLPQQGWAFTNTAMWIVFSYIWLPFMILPVYAALERIPDSYLEASRDLGADKRRL